MQKMFTFVYWQLEEFLSFKIYAQALNEDLHRASQRWWYRKRFRIWKAFLNEENLEYSPVFSILYNGEVDFAVKIETRSVSHFSIPPSKHIITKCFCVNNQLSILLLQLFHNSLMYYWWTSINWLSVWNYEPSWITSTWYFIKKKKNI